MRGLRQPTRGIGTIVWQGTNYQLFDRPAFGMVIAFMNPRDLPPELLGKDAGKVLSKNAVKAFLLEEGAAGQLRHMLTSSGHDGFPATRASIETIIAIIIGDDRPLLDQAPPRFTSKKYRNAMGRIPGKEESRRWDFCVQGFSLREGAERAMDIQVHCPWGEVYPAVLEQAEKRQLLVSGIALMSWGPEFTPEAEPAGTTFGR